MINKYIRLIILLIVLTSYYSCQNETLDHAILTEMTAPSCMSTGVSFTSVDFSFEMKEFDCEKHLINVHDTAKYYHLYINGLDSTTTYYYKSYIYYNDVYYYSEINSFTTIRPSDVIKTGSFDSESFSIKSFIESNGVRELIQSCGICYSSDSIPVVDINQTIRTSINKDGSFTINIAKGDIPFDTLVYYRAFVEINGKTYYGYIKTYVKNWIVAEEVDLGLSVNWASFNLGAISPEDYGHYYSWGEIETKNSYYWANYKFCKETSSTLTKYCNNNELGDNSFTDNKTFLDLKDDVAHISWGESWRLPSKYELEELKNHCTWTWITEKGVKGYLISSNIPGYQDKKIFLPAAGQKCRSNTLDVNSIGYYWSSSLDTLIPSNANGLCFGHNYTNEHNAYRSFGLPIRPVCPSEEWLSHITISFLEDTIICTNQKLSVIFKYDDEDYDFHSDCTWLSDNPTIASVDSIGNLSTHANGVVHITASYKDIIASCTVICDYKNIQPSMVDLGLSVKWATCNLGAFSSYEHGNYYAWGEMEEKVNYTKTTYNYSYKIDSNTKILESDYDVAHIILGGNWRMPTINEWKELINYCHWTWTTINGVKGYKVSRNDNYIFLPAAGYYTSYLNESGTNGYYWSSTYNNSNHLNTAQTCFFNMRKQSIVERECYRGHPIRPVYKNKNYY